ncbi:MAG: hypothetical protein K6E86_02150 [Bacteroidales bacterium]|nr:hypothetical protein [Bacteroidales bacterium]
MRQEIYAKIKERLQAEVPELQHIDLWNRNVEFLDQEEAWARPAAFIEFMPITWQPYVSRTVYKGSAKIQIHIVTDWDGTDTDCLSLGDKVAKALTGLSGEKFYSFDMAATYTNHNHEEIIENIEEFSYKCIRPQ